MNNFPINKNNYEKGIDAEKRAKFFLLKNNYKIIGQRIKSRIGEIDILAKKDEDVFIFEVKLRKTLELAANAIDMKQIQRSIDTFYTYAQKNNLTYQQLQIKALLITNTEITMQEIIFY